MTGWSPPGSSPSKDSWQWDVGGKGWSPPGSTADARGIQVEMGDDFSYSPEQSGGFHTMLSPAGTQAPTDLTNYTPATSEVHAPGAAAPKEFDNLSVMPAVHIPPKVGTGQGAPPQGRFVDQVTAQGAPGGQQESGDQPRADSLLDRQGNIIPGYIVVTITDANGLPRQEVRTDPRVQPEARATLQHLGRNQYVWVNPSTQEISQPFAIGPDTQDDTRYQLTTIKVPGGTQLVGYDPKTNQLVPVGQARSGGQPAQAGNTGQQIAGNQQPNVGGADAGATATGSRKFSPFDATFRKYAGDLAANDEFISMVAAATYAESGWNPTNVGDNGDSVGLFQINKVHGLPDSVRNDPDASARFMMPKFVDAYQRGKAQGLSGRKLSEFVGGTAEGSEARYHYRYGDSYDAIMHGDVVPRGPGDIGSASWGSAGGAGAGTPGFTPDAPRGKYHTVASGGKLYIYDDETGQVVKTIQGDEPTATVGNRLLQKNPDGTWGVAYEAPPNLQLKESGNYLLGVDPETGHSTVLFEKPGEPSNGMVPPGAQVVAHDLDGSTRTYGTASMRPAVGDQFGPPAREKAAPKPAAQSPAQAVGATPTGAAASPAASPLQPVRATQPAPPRKPLGYTGAEHEDPYPRNLPTSPNEHPATDERPWMPNETPAADERPPAGKSRVEWGGPNLPTAGGSTSPFSPAMPNVGRQQMNPTPATIVQGTSASPVGSTTDPDLSAPGRIGSPWQIPQNQATPSAAVGGWAHGNTPPNQITPTSPYDDAALDQPLPSDNPWDPKKWLQRGLGMGQAAGPAAADPGGWQPPVDPSQVVGGGNKWGQQVSMEGKHEGTDLQAYSGTPALSPVDGTVVGVTNDPEGLGLQVHVRDSLGQVHTLAHLLDTQVEEGQRVSAGDLLGQVGQSGAGATGPHLDYRVQGQGGEYVNPEPLLGELGRLPEAPNTVGEGQDFTRDDWRNEQQPQQPNGIEGAMPYDWGNTNNQVPIEPQVGGRVPEEVPGYTTDQWGSMPQPQLGAEQSNMSIPEGLPDMSTLGSYLTQGDYDRGDNWKRENPETEGYNHYGQGWPAAGGHTGPHLEASPYGNPLLDDESMTAGGPQGARVNVPKSAYGRMGPHSVQGPLDSHELNSSQQNPWDVAGSNPYDYEALGEPPRGGYDDVGSRAGGNSSYPTDTPNFRVVDRSLGWEGVSGQMPRPSLSPEQLNSSQQDPNLAARIARAERWAQYDPSWQAEANRLRQQMNEQDLLGEGAREQGPEWDRFSKAMGQDPSSQPVQPNAGQTYSQPGTHQGAPSYESPAQSQGAPRYEFPQHQWANPMYWIPAAAQQGGQMLRSAAAGAAGMIPRFYADQYNEMMGRPGTGQDSSGLNMPQMPDDPQSLVGDGQGQSPSGNREHIVHDANAWEPWTTDQQVGKGGSYGVDWGEGGSGDVVNWGGPQDMSGGGDMGQDPYSPGEMDPRSVGDTTYGGVNDMPGGPAGGVPNIHDDYIRPVDQARLENDRRNTDLRARELDARIQNEQQQHEVAMQQAQTYAAQVAEQRRHDKAMEQLDRLKTAVQFESQELDRRMQLVTQGAFGSRAQLDLMKGALSNPWLQNLTGMTPGFGTPGWGPENGGILKNLFQGWAPPPGYNFQTMSDYKPQFSAGSILQGKSDQGGGGSQPVQPKSTFDQSGFQQARQDWRQGGRTGDKPSRENFIAQAATDAATGNAGQSPVGQKLAAGWGGYAPLGGTPPEPSYDQFSQMSPFEQSAYRTTAEASQPWGATQSSLQRQWANQGVTAPPKTTALTAAANGPLGIQQRQNTSEILGQSPKQYWGDQSRTWSKAQSPNVSPW